MNEHDIFFYFALLSICPILVSLFLVSEDNFTNCYTSVNYLISAKWRFYCIKLRHLFFSKYSIDIDRAA